MPSKFLSGKTIFFTTQPKSSRFNQNNKELQKANQTIQGNFINPTIMIHTFNKFRLQLKISKGHTVQQI